MGDDYQLQQDGARVSTYVVLGYHVQFGERKVLATRSCVYHEVTLPEPAYVNGVDVAADDVASPTLPTGTSPSVVPASEVASMVPAPTFLRLRTLSRQRRREPPSVLVRCDPRTTASTESSSG